MELLAAVATEMVRVEPVVGRLRIELLTIEPQRSHMLRLKRAVKPSGPADVLMEFEGEERAVVTAPRPLLFAQTCRQQTIPDCCFRVFGRGTGMFHQPCGRIG